MEQGGSPNPAKRPTADWQQDEGGPGMLDDDRDLLEDFTRLHATP
jgi:hypothetical protein